MDFPKSLGTLSGCKYITSLTDGAGGRSGGERESGCTDPTPGQRLDAWSSLQTQVSRCACRRLPRSVVPHSLLRKNVQKNV